MKAGVLVNAVNVAVIVAVAVVVVIVNQLHLSFCPYRYPHFQKRDTTTYTRGNTMKIDKEDFYL